MFNPYNLFTINLLTGVLMKSRISLFIMCLLLLGSAVQIFAQQMAAPQIDTERRVTFKIQAPDAKDVRVINLSDSAAMGAKEYVLVKGADGVWSGVTNPCRPGFHYYELSIDGFRCSDPASQAYFGWGKWCSGLEVPGEGLDFYLAQNTPRGEVRLHWYMSQTTGTLRKCLVYTPPDYDKNLTARYPVLYLQHGAGESELGWTMQGKVNVILDNLIAAGKAKPMLIVMDNGYAARAGAENPHRPRGEDNAFADLVVKEVVPMIDANYRTLNDRNNRAIAGLSMGAGQALNIGLSNPVLFASVGAFSGGVWRLDINTSFNGLFKDAAKFNETYRLFWFGCGDLDGGYAGMQTFHDTLEKQGIKHVWFPGPGSHEWQVWRQHIYEFAQVLFRQYIDTRLICRR